MAFELIFFKQKEARIILDEVVNFFSSRENFKVKPLDDDYYQFIYLNEETSTKFVITYNVANELITEVAFDENYEYCFTYFSMNYLRPSFYAEEAMPVVEAFSKQFNLYIYDGQNPIEAKDALKLYSKEQLIDSYEQNNEIACKEFHAQYPLMHTEKAKTDYYYHYTQHKNQFETDVVIPDLSFIQNLESKELFTVFTWNDFDETLIPKCDYILLITYTKGFLGMKKKQTTLIPYQDLTALLSSYLNSYQEDLEILIFENKEITEDLIQNLPQYNPDDYEIVNIEEIVDVL